MLKDNVPVPEEDDDAYTLYDFYTNLSSATVALYSGFSQDYVEEEETTSAYALTTAPGDIGSVYFHPADVKGYYGVTPEHSYMNSGVGIDKLNTRSSLTGENGSFAGIINTKYIKSNENYPLRDEILASAVMEDKDDVQAMMIYNANNESYGYIGEGVTISQSALANISVKIKVVGENAFANIYLVDTKTNEKNILTFSDFTVNNNVVKGYANGTKIEGSALKFAIKVTEDMCNEDGWTTVNFFLGAGNDAKDLRLEIWNGTRDGSQGSQGMVLVEEISVITATAFYEPERYEDAFSVTGNPLYDAYIKSANAFTTEGKIIAHTQELNKNQQEFNAEYPDKKVTYSPKYIWAETTGMIYAIFGTVDPLPENPYSTLVEEETTTTGCNATINQDPSAFWLGFSSIALGVVLVLAIIALFIKNYRRRHAYDNSGAKSHYTVKSRTSYAKTDKKVEEETPVDDYEETIPETEEETTQQVEEEKEQTLDEYVYGDVQDFGETEENSEEEVETETTEESSEN